ncbi:MAG: sulfotransferase family protein [Phycisphaerae bacterium]
MSNTDRNYVTIVSGLPRSGTSMMMKMLDAGGIAALTDNVRTADEDNPKGYFEFEAVKKTKKDPAWLERAGGMVVKMVHLLLLDLPLDREYRVIFMRRKLEEVVKSQNVMLERNGKDTGALADEQVMRVFRAQMDKVDLYAKENARHLKMLDVNYNDLLADPRPAIQAVNEFLDGTLNTQAMATVVDPSLYRQRSA